MTAPSRQGGARVAAALLAEHGGDSNAPVLPEALERACASLVVRLTPWIGSDGCARLLRRALATAAQGHPSLEGVAVNEAGPPHLDGLASVTGPGAPAAAEALLAATYEQLGRLVGEPVAVRLVLPGTSELWDVASPAGEDL